jgi:uncharacterized protein (DUF302 family)
MAYYFSKTLDTDFDGALKRTVDALKEEGFGVLTEIDVADTLKKKINADFRRYRILGACNPKFAFEALQAEDKIGTMLPCNVVVQQLPDGKIEVAAVDPVASMMAIDNPKLGQTAKLVREKLQRVVERV